VTTSVKQDSDATQKLGKTEPVQRKNVTNYLVFILSGLFVLVKEVVMLGVDLASSIEAVFKLFLGDFIFRAQKLLLDKMESI
jgi:hypothetical protein